jgi:hypothetical protein
VRVRCALTQPSRTQLDECEATALDDLAAFDDGAPLAAQDFEADGVAAAAAYRNACAALAERRAAGEPDALLPPPPAPPLLLSECERLRLTAYRLRAARERFAAGAAAALRDDAALCAAWHTLYENTDAFSQGWLTAGVTAVAAAAAAGCTNVLVTAGCLLPTLAKLLLFKLDGLFPADAILSARREGKAACFARIVARHGGRARYCAVGDGAEEAAAARAMRWPLLPIAPLPADGALPPHAITTELLARRLADCACEPGSPGATQDAVPEAHAAC